MVFRLFQVTAHSSLGMTDRVSGLLETKSDVAYSHRYFSIVICPIELSTVAITLMVTSP